MARTKKKWGSSYGKRKKMSRAINKHLNCPRMLYVWSFESILLGAFKAVQEGWRGVNRAALSFRVPRTTLKESRW